jgi:hypothetical protein
MINQSQKLHFDRVIHFLLWGVVIFHIVYAMKLLSYDQWQFLGAVETSIEAWIIYMKVGIMGFILACIGLIQKKYALSGVVLILTVLSVSGYLTMGLMRISEISTPYFYDIFY